MQWDMANLLFNLYNITVFSEMAVIRKRLPRVTVTLGVFFVLTLAITLLPQWLFHRTQGAVCFVVLSWRAAEEQGQWLCSVSTAHQCRLS